MKPKTLLALVLAISFAGILAVAQTVPPAAGQISTPSAPKPAARPAAPTAPSQVDSVIKLVKGGMSEPFIINYLQKNNKAADLTPSDIVKLKEAGVSETVIGVLMDPASAPVAAVSPAPPVEATLPAPVAAPPPPPDPVPAPAPVAVFGQERPEPEYFGVAYLYDGTTNKLINLERQVAKPAAKVKAFGYGGIKSVSEIPGVNSQVRLPADQKLAFVIKAPAGLDPQSLVEIVRLTRQKDHREILQMQSKGLMGLGGVKNEADKANVPFNSSKYSDTSIQVSPVEPLPPGEYAIRRPSSPTLFCFGVDPVGSSR